MSAVGALGSFAAAVAAALAIAAAREGIHAWPTARRWLAQAVAPLARAGSEGYEPTDDERRRLWIVGSVACGLGMVTLFGFGSYLAVIGSVPVASNRLIAHRRSRYRARIEEGLGPWARSLGDAIAAGQPVRAAVAGSFSQANPAVAGELSRVRSDLETGVPLEEALAHLSRRTGSPSLGSIVSALGVAARSGGEVASLLRRFAAANDERVALLADARSATAQARMTGVAVAAMPAAGVLFAELTSPGFTAAMLADATASTLLLVSVLIQVGAFAAIRKISGVRR